MAATRGRCLPAAVGAAVVVAAAAAGCASAGKTSSLRFESQLSSTRTVFISPGRSLGQELIFTAMIYPPGGPAANGRSEGTCIRAEPGNGEVYNCQLTFILPGGTVYALALASHDGPAAGAVAGGTGSYANVRGSFAYAATGSPRIALTFKLTG
ncbi:MAG TPA: hypothetical protein VFR49_06765 [Solirubrobacteraceae bacterium]|nr:hypothetical protein [Solirubrobacteraceae bacterium]